MSIAAVSTFISVLSGGLVNPLDSNIVTLIESAEYEVSECFGNLRNKAIALLVLHQNTLINNGEGNGSTGQASSISEGDLSKSFHSVNAKNGDAYYSQTSYGLQFLQLRRMSIVGFRNRTITNGCTTD